jgi:predicted SAM-dependent methyltransferase
LRNALRWQKFVTVPLLGRLLKFYFRLEGDSAAEVRLRVAEQRAFFFKDALSEINQRQDQIEKHLPSLLQTLEDLSQRQRAFETQQLPTLLQTLSELNHRQLASDNDRDNLVKSVPVALRKITRDLVEIRANQEDMSNLADQSFIEIQEQIEVKSSLINERVTVKVDELEGALRLIDERINENGEKLASVSNSTEQRIASTRNQLESTLRSIDQRIIETREQLAKASNSTDRRFFETDEQLTNVSKSTDQRFLETQGQIESASSLTEKRIAETRGKLENASKDVDYLLKRVEFIRRELMFEMRYGASASPRDGSQLNTEIVIVSPQKLAVARKEGIRVNLGCGHIALDGYINVDRRALPGVDIVAEVDNLPFAKGDVDEIFSAHLIEHFPQEQLRRKLLNYWFGLLKPGGRFRAIVPDAEGMMKAYLTREYPFERLREVTFGGQDYDGDFHFNMLNTDSLTELLSEAGFDDIRVIAENRENGGCKEFEIAAVRPNGEV